MQTAHEILVEESTVRLQRDTAEKQWAALVRRCRVPKWFAPFWFQSIMALVLFGCFWPISRPGDYRGTFIVAAIFVFYCVPAHLVSLRRREQALLAMIEREAPGLYRKLQREGLV